MWRDITGKTGYRNMQGANYLYGNLKLLNDSELSNALADGITTFTPPAKPLPTEAELLKKARKSKLVEMEALFEQEASKDVVIDTVSYAGGYESAIRAEGARNLAALAVGGTITFYDTGDKPISKNPAQAKAIVIALGQTYSDLVTIQRGLRVDIAAAADIAAIEAIVIPWTFDGG